MESALGHNVFVRLHSLLPEPSADENAHYGLVVGGNNSTSSLVFKFNNVCECALWLCPDANLTLVDDVPPDVRTAINACLSEAAQERILLHRHRALGHCFTFDDSCVDEEHSTCCSPMHCEGHTCTPAAVPAPVQPRTSKRARVPVARYQP